MKFQKSILRAIAADGGVGLSEPSKLVDLVDEFCHRHRQLNILKYASGGLSGGLLLISLSAGIFSAGMVAALGLFAGAAGAALKHGLSSNDKRELALLSRHRCLFGALAGIEKNSGIEATLARYEELIGCYSHMDDCFYFAGAVIPGTEIVGAISAASTASLSSGSQSADAPTTKSGRLDGLFASPARTDLAITTDRVAGLPDVLSAAAPPTTKSGRLDGLFASPARTDLAIAPESATTEPGDLVDLMSARLKSCIIAAPPRAGKGIVVAYASRKLQQKYPDCEIWLIDPKDEASESGYWNHIPMDRRVHFDLRQYSVDVDRTEGIADEFLSRFNASPARAKLLIVDEFVSLNSRLSGAFMSRLKSFLVSISSSGEVGLDGLGKFAWIVTQSPYVADIGFRTKGLRAAFTKALIFDSSTVGFLKIAASSEFCSPIDESQGYSLTSKTGRAFYYSIENTWGHVNVYPPFQPDTKRSKLSHPLSQSLAANLKAEEAVATIQDGSEEPAISKEVIDAVGEISQKLLAWMDGVGQKYAIDGYIAAACIMENFRYKYEGVTKRLDQKMLLKVVKRLLNNNQIEFLRGKGVKPTPFVDDLGLFT